VKFFLVALLLSLSLPRLAFASEASIRILSHSFARGDKLILSDIADFSGFSDVELQSLKKVALGNAPAFGEKRKYTNQALAEILRANLKKIQDKGSRSIKLIIPDEVMVEGSGFILDKKALSQSLVENLKRVCDTCDYKIEDLRLPEIPMLSPRSTWEVRTDYHKLRGPFNISIEVINSAGEKTLYWVAGRVSVWKKVPVSTHVLAINDRLDESDIKWIKRDITFIYDTTPEENELAGAQIKMALAPDQILVRGDLVRKKALNRGESVTLTAAGSAWNVTIRGIAQENGYLGDTVRVLNPDTKKIVSGLVVAQGTVEVK